AAQAVCSSLKIVCADIASTSGDKRADRPDHRGKTGKHVLVLSITGFDPSGHKWPLSAARHGPDLLYLPRDLWPWGKPYEAARIHHVAPRIDMLMRTGADHPEGQARIAALR